MSQKKRFKTYICKGNQNKVSVYFIDDKIDELVIGGEYEENGCGLVIGYEDLKNILKQAKKIGNP